MPNYRRYRVPGGTYFFTVNLLERRQDTLVRHIDSLRDAVRKTRRQRPFHIDAWVVVPDHMFRPINHVTGSTHYHFLISNVDSSTSNA